MRPTATQDTTEVRIDRWLWNTRFFKSRGLARTAVRGGHVRVNGERVKASRIVRVGDSVRIQRGPYEVTVNVTKTPSRRGSATEAQACYEETETSKVEGQRRALDLKLDRASHPRPQRRPDKRDRRLLRERQRGRD